MGKQLVTILESDESAKTAHVQVNDEDAIGTEAEGRNVRHEFSAEQDAEQPWKGTVGESLSALYPGAMLHTPDSLNATVKQTLLRKGLRVERKDGTLVTPAEDALLRQREADAETARLAELAAEAARALRDAEVIEAGDVGTLHLDG